MRGEYKEYRPIKGRCYLVSLVSMELISHWSQLATPPAPSPWASPVSLSISSAAS